MAARLYWRLNIAAVDAGTLIAIAEIEMRSVAAGANVATGGTVTTSGEQVGSEGSKAFDATLTTNWLSTAGVTRAFIRYQFASAVDIVEHTVTSADAITNRSPKQWTIQSSDDGNTWITEAIVNNQTTWAVNEKRIYNHAAYPLAIGVCPDMPNRIPVSQVTVATPSTVVSIAGAAYTNQKYTGARKFVSGTVKQNGVLVSRLVRAYHRKTGQVLGEAYSDATTGVFSIETVGLEDNCYVVALDDIAQTPDFNALIYDLVIPV